MSKLLSLIIAAAFASVNVAAVAAADAPKKEEKKVEATAEKKAAKAEKKDAKAVKKEEKKAAK